MLRYDPETGEFWRKTGSVWLNRKVRVKVRQKGYFAHRLAWFMMTGEWPKNEIDHINKDSLDNRWANLREATHQENCQNRRFSRSKSGVHGVGLHNGKWRARINGDHIGYFKTVEEASAAYHREAAKRYGNYALRSVAP